MIISFTVMKDNIRPNHKQAWIKRKGSSHLSFPRKRESRISNKKIKNKKNGDEKIYYSTGFPLPRLREHKLSGNKPRFPLPRE
jgi:hypothetical protein